MSAGDDKTVPSHSTSTVLLAHQDAAKSINTSTESVQQTLSTNRELSNVREKSQSPNLDPNEEDRLCSTAKTDSNDSSLFSTSFSVEGTAVLDNNDDFEEPTPFRDATWQHSVSSRRNRLVFDERPENADIQSQIPDDVLRNRAQFEQMLSDEVSGNSNKLKVPRIFYASRTHAQLAQVVGELKKSEYRPAMVVLASRNEYCLHPVVRRQAGKDDKCKLLVSENSCEFYLRTMSVASAIRRQMPPDPMDIEELNHLASELRGCAYHATSELYKSAELILCPYNYLIDPVVREARGIGVRGDIVILDEAHNIEDHAREAASFSSDLSHLHTVKEEITELVLSGVLGTPNSDVAVAYRSVLELFTSICLLGDGIVESGYLRQSEDFEIATFEREELLNCLNSSNIDIENIALYRNAIKTINESRESDDDDQQNDFPTSHHDAVAHAKRPSKFSVGRERKRPHARRLRGGVDETSFDVNDDVSASSQRLTNIFQRSRSRRKDSIAGVNLAEALVTSLNFCLKHPDSFVFAVKRVTNSWESATEVNLWCLNAAVPFNALSRSARSVIVTSGTLSPINSFAGELGVCFGIAKSLPHVVDVRRQVFATVVGSGPGNVKLDATYRGASSFEFQDSLGRAIVAYCNVIPGGVLVFFPSYRFLKILIARWKVSGIWGHLEMAKGALYIEPSSRGDEFDNMISSYSSNAKSDQGAVLFGVCRGKVSEGLDFKDASARGVVIVGIPYPNSRCPQLLKKRAWNDRERHLSKRQELLSGSAWYDMQAFRALNQALGRCVRHRRDYGAILLLDLRFKLSSVLQQLPNWVRSGIRQNDSSHDSAVVSLAEFFKHVEEHIPSQ